MAQVHFRRVCGPRTRAARENDLAAAVKNALTTLVCIVRCVCSKGCYVVTLLRKYVHAVFVLPLYCAMGESNSVGCMYARTPPLLCCAVGKASQLCVLGRRYAGTGVVVQGAAALKLSGCSSAHAHKAKKNSNNQLFHQPPACVCDVAVVVFIAFIKPRLCCDAADGATKVQGRGDAGGAAP